MTDTQNKAATEDEARRLVPPPDRTGEIVSIARVDRLITKGDHQ